MKTINWDEYFMALSKVSAMRSKDPNTKVGAAIINKRNRVIALGYNGMPDGDDTTFPWKREGEITKTKYAYVVHAEVNAILNATQPTLDSILYVSLFPCSNCAKIIVQAGIKEIVYEDDKYIDTVDNEIAKNILKNSKIKYRKIDEVKVKIN